MNNFYRPLKLPVPFTTSFPSIRLEGELRQKILKRGFGRDRINEQFISWLNSVGLTVSETRWNRYFECNPNSSFNIHADSLRPDLPRTKLNIMFNHHDTDVVFYEPVTEINHSRYINGSIRIYPKELCREVFRTSSPSPCLLNSSEIHSVINHTNLGETWICYSLTLTDLFGNNVAFEEATEKLKPSIG